MRNGALHYGDPLESSQAHSISVPLILGFSESPMYHSADLMWQLVEIMPSPIAKVEAHMQWLTALKAQLAVKEVDAKSVVKELVTLQGIDANRKILIEEMTTEQQRLRAEAPKRKMLAKVMKE